MGYYSKGYRKALKDSGGDESADGVETADKGCDQQGGKARASDDT